MLTLTEAIERFESDVRSVLAAPRPVTRCDAVVSSILSILSSGLYPGLTPWSIFKLLQRLDSQEMNGYPLGRRLRFACKTVSMITTSLTEQNDNAKAKAFVKCALNTGHLTAIVELLSCIGTVDRSYRLDDADDSSLLLMHDVWGHLLSGGTDDCPDLVMPTVGKLLEPFIADGVNILRCTPGGALEDFYPKFMGVLSRIGGPGLSSYLEMKAVSGEGVLFCLDLHSEDDSPIEQVYPSEKCLSTNRSSDEPSSPVTKKKVIKKVIVKRKIVKSESSVASPCPGPQDSEVKSIDVSDEPKTISSPKLEFGEITEIKNSTAFLQLKQDLRHLLDSSSELLACSSKGVLAYPSQTQNTLRRTHEGLDCEWIDTVANTLTHTPSTIKSSLEHRIDHLSSKLGASLM